MRQILVVQVRLGTVFARRGRRQLVLYINANQADVTSFIPSSADFHILLPVGAAPTFGYLLDLFLSSRLMMMIMMMLREVPNCLLEPRRVGFP